ncbi:hypothetical protein [Derxia lacustris]|uniref:hypothetical protein n=1 Tax=Derxia lacustris TaxID=764842 RepID=UPI00111BF7EC|nr:hypothetical protein [Derxia lacustris]
MAPTPFQPQANESVPSSTEMPPNSKTEVSGDASTGSPARPSEAPPPTQTESIFSWKSLLRIAGLGTVIPGLITAGVSIATMITNCTTEQIKVNANHEDQKLRLAVASQAREEKLAQDERERRDINAARLRELRTKYVDMALGRQLCLDYRVRVFGYLVAVVENSEKAWAQEELRKATEAQDRINALKNQLGEAQANLVSPTQNAIKQFQASGPIIESTNNVLAVFRQTNEQKIKSIQTQLADLKADDPQCYEPTAQNHQ